MNKTFTVKRTIDIDPEFYAECALDDLNEHIQDNLKEDYSLDPTDRNTEELADKIYYEVLKVLSQKIKEELENYEREEN